MKRSHVLLVILAASVCLWPRHVLTDAVGYVNAACWRADSGSISQSFDAGSASNRILLVGWCINNTPSTLTYNGTNISTTLAADSPSEGGYFIQSRYLLNPASGSNTFAYTPGGGLEPDVCIAVYSGVDQTTPIDGTASDHHNGTNIPVSPSVTTSVTGAWLAGFACNASGATTPAMDPTQTNTLRAEVHNSSYIQVLTGDSAGTVATGAHTIGFCPGSTFVGACSGTSFNSGIAVGLAPASGGGSTRKRMPIGSGGAQRLPLIDFIGSPQHDVHSQRGVHSVAHP